MALVRPVHPAPRRAAHRRACRSRSCRPSTSTSSTGCCSSRGGASAWPGRCGHPTVRERAVALRSAGLTLRSGRRAPARRVRRRVAAITKDAVAALHPPPARPTARRSASRTACRPARCATSTRSCTPRSRTHCAGTGSPATSPTPPLPRRRRPRGRTDPKAWTAEQLRAFLDYTADSQYLPAWIFLATSGCRRGECLGLRWSDIDLDDSDGDHRPPGHRARPPSDREGAPEDEAGPPHPPRLRHGGDAPQAAGPSRPRRSCASAAGYHDKGYVFCQPDGRRTTPSASHSSSIATSATSTGTTPIEPLPTLTLHGLRHTWATLALERRHRHQDRQRAPQPQQHPHHAGDLHPRDPADAERRRRTCRWS